MLLTFSKVGVSMTDLLWGLTTKVSLVFLVIYIFSSTKMFNKILHNRKFTLRDQLIVSLVFGFMGILGTYSGIPYMGAIVNNRVIGVVVGGLIGGPVVGVLAGLIAGGHRFLIDIGGFTALSCGISTALEGLIAGLLSQYFFRSKNKVMFGFFAGILTETVQMIVILLVAKPFVDALILVRTISIPMILTNSIGIALMIVIYQNMLKNSDLQGAFRSEQALRIARETMKDLRKGLTVEASQNVVKIIRNIAKVDAVAITDLEKVLAYEGIESLGFKTGDPIHSSITRQAMDNHVVISSLLNMDVKFKSKKNLSVVIAPLIVNGDAIGSIKLYSLGRTKISLVDEELASGLAMLFSTQLELSHLDEQKHLLNKAELSVLQAKINPHFLFNALNTIHALIRIKPEQARDLLVKFSDYFRNNIIHNDCIITLEKELDQVMAYLELEKARFGDRLQIEFEVPENLDIEVPPLIIQPLIENAIKHGIFKHKSSGKVKIKITAFEERYEVSIEDDGIGIDPFIVESIYSIDETTNHIGLLTTHKRLLATYKNNKGLYFETKPDIGTLVSFIIPKGEKA
ncbi:MAG: histidine kinase [Clostridiales bacterium]|nr:histidine kinase [Clostridiales bacterium]